VSSRHERSSPGADWDNETGRPEETDGENPEGSIGQDGSKCVKQDGTSLSPTSSTPKVRSSTASRRTPLRRYHEPDEPANTGARRAVLVRTLGIVVLAALMGLTSWVVASISTWLVPVYVTAMVLIFVMPQVQLLGEPEPAGEPAGVSADRAREATSPASSGAASPGATTLGVDGSPEASATGAKPAGSPTPKRRRTRGQGRKPVKPGPEPAVTTSPAAWIRIGPGKFVRADSQDQGCASAPVPHAPLEAAEASIEAKSSPPDLVEETNPNAVSTAVDVPNRADLNESGPSPEHEIPSEEPAAIADPEPGSSVVALGLKADVGWQESNSTAAPATIGIDVDSPADLIVAEPVTEEYGIAPSAFGPSLLEASLEKEDHKQEWTDLPDSTGTGRKTPFDAGNGNGNRCNWMRLKLRSGVHIASGCLPRLEKSRRLQNVRSGERRRGFAELGRAANCPGRAMVQRNFGRSSRAHRGYQPRSPPARS